jgi:hypothetical protein
VFGVDVAEAVRVLDLSVIPNLHLGFDIGSRFAFRSFSYLVRK